MNHAKITSILLALPVAAIAWGMPSAAIAAPTQVAPVAAPPVVECVPACRTGFLCVQGQCVSSCNPPCAANETCTANGQCIAAAPTTVPASTPVPASAAVTPPPGVQPNQPGSVQPAYVAPPAQGSYAPAPPPPTPAEAGSASASRPERRFGQGFQVALSAENLFGYVHTWDTWSINKVRGASVAGTEISSKGDNVAFLGNRGGANLSPGLAVDFVLGQGFTIGGGFYYASTGGDETVKQGTTTTTETNYKNSSLSAFGVATRVGYVLMFNEIVGIWPRLGLGYESGSIKSYSYSGTNNQTETETDIDLSNFSIRPEVMLVISPVPHFALLLGAASRFGVAGSQTQKQAGVTTLDGDYTESGIGVTAGLMGYL